VPDGVDASVDDMQTTRIEATIDRVLANAEAQQLRPGDNSVLSSGKLGDLRVGFPSHTEG
jgi:hypothetical protein